MKKAILASVLAMACVSAFAAPAKTSKAKVMTDTQMSEVKGQGTVTVWTWTGTQYLLCQVGNTGPNGATFDIYIGGPEDTYGNH